MEAGGMEGGSEAPGPTAQTSPATLRCVGLTKYFGAVRALDNVNLELRGGEVVALVGDNGAGKSTLVKIISGMHQPDIGELWLGDRRLTHLTATKPREDREIETVHQQLALCDNLDAASNIILGREPVKFRLGPLRFIDRKRAPLKRRRRAWPASAPVSTVSMSRCGGSRVVSARASALLAPASAAAA